MRLLHNELFIYCAVLQSINVIVIVGVGTVGRCSATSWVVGLDGQTFQ